MPVEAYDNDGPLVLGVVMGAATALVGVPLTVWRTSAHARSACRDEFRDGGAIGTLLEEGRIETDVPLAA